MSSKIPSTITFKRPGTAPPLFLAGSFSDPEWEPKEMEYKTEDDGEHTFQSEVMITPGEDYQFKLRMGEGSWWILAENYPIGMLFLIILSHMSIMSHTLQRRTTRVTRTMF